MFVCLLDERINVQGFIYEKERKYKMTSASLGNLFQFGDSSQKDPFSSKKKETMKEEEEDSDSENKKKEDTFSSVKKILTEGKRGKKKVDKNAEPDETEKENDSENEEDTFSSSSSSSSKKVVEGKKGRSIKKIVKSAKSKNENGNESDDDKGSDDDDDDDGDGEGFHNMTTNKVPFWVTNPNVLLDSRYITEWFPVEGMSYNQKLNAISRLVILLTVISFVFLKAMRLLWIGGVCLLVIFLLHYSQTRSVGGKQEGFFGNAANDKFRGTDPALHAIVNFATNDPSKIGKKEYFDVPKINNPYNNVLVTDIVDNPDKLPAPPAYYPETEKAILDRTKEAIQKMNPTFPGIMKKLFSSFDDHFEFEQSMRQFHSNPATTVPNDQGAFAEFCYGEMISCKEGNQFACARDSARYNLY